MGLTEYKFADLIEPVSETNSKLLYGSNDVHGMTITKEIIPTKANMTGTDLSKFLVVHPGDFIYNPRKYSLQGTTQGNGLTGGVPPVRFSM